MSAAAVTAALWRREMLRFLRDRTQIFGAVSRTVLWLLVLGFGLGAVIGDVAGFAYAQYLLPGVAMLNILFAALQSAMMLVWDREHGLLRQILVSPAPLPAVALGKLLGAASIATLHGCVPLALAPLLGIALGPLQVLLALLVMFATGLAVAGLGVVVASRLRTLEGFGSISNGIVQPLYFLSGAIFPLGAALPDWLRWLVHANPLSHPLDLLRAVLLGFHQLPVLPAIGVTLLLPVLALLAASAAMARMGTGGRPRRRGS